MGREKKGGPPAGSHAKDRHKRDRKGNIIDWTAPLPPGLVAMPQKPQGGSKHKSWFELIENKDKKKKLEFKFTEERQPPPGFEFVPIGNPALTTACKELSREQGAMIFIVTSSNTHLRQTLSYHVNRVGHHIRQAIVEQARESLGDDQHVIVETNLGVPEPIPESQEEIDKQADAAIRDLFPRIPNTDRQMIIQHSFNKEPQISFHQANQSKGDPLVGLAPDITLSRRVQLAVLAHIRHTHTRYDKLLRETTYVNARRAVEPLCLDILVKWRGDEETGRDQLDEILCEVIVISDSDSDDGSDDEEDDDEPDSPDTPLSGDAVAHTAPPPPEPAVAAPGTSGSIALPTTNHRRGESRPRTSYAHAGRKSKILRKDRRAAMKAQRGFNRFQAARDRAWHQAIERQRLDSRQSAHAGTGMSVAGPSGVNTRPWRSPERSPDSFFPEGSRGLGESSRRAPSHTLGDPWPIVGSRNTLHTASRVDQIHYSQPDLKDHLVPSIEPPSPQHSHFTTQFPSRSYELQPGHGAIYVSNARGEPPSYRRPVDAPGREPGPASGYHVTREESDFITLPPRSQTGRAPAALLQYRESPAPLGMQPRAMATYAPMDLGGGSGPQSPYRGNPASHGADRPALRSVARPIWIDGDEGSLPRSTSRPVVLPDDREMGKQPVIDRYGIVSDRYPPGHARDVIYPPEHPPGPSYPDRGHGYQQVERRGEKRIHFQDDDDDFVEIVRVTNKFPRRYDSPSRPADAPSYTPSYAPSYALQSRSQQQFEAFPVSDSVGRREFASAAAPSQRLERVVKAEEPAYYGGFGGDHRLSGGYPVGVQRQEKVVGIEYISSPHINEPRAYQTQPIVPQCHRGDESQYGRYPPPATVGQHPEVDRYPLPNQADARKEEFITIRRGA